ncbi:hypothetical protein LCGC14_2234480, partial [marine sediment metagenome]
MAILLTEPSFEAGDGNETLCMVES